VGVNSSSVASASALWPALTGVGGCQRFDDASAFGQGFVGVIGTASVKRARIEGDVGFRHHGAIAVSGHQ